MRARQSFRHEALLWRDADDYRDVLVPFIDEGIAAGEPVMVATVAEHEQWLRDGLGRVADEVRFVDIAQHARNPSRIMPVWQEFLDGAGRGQPVRGVGEPIWPGRRSEEIAEVQLLEALVNLAVDPGLPFWLVCPYDLGSLDPSVVDEARRSHPALLGTDGYRGSPSYGGRSHIESMFEAELEELTGASAAMTYDPSSVGRLYAFVVAQASSAGVSADRAVELAAASQRLAAGSLHRGATRGRLIIWDQADAVICELVDEVRLGDPLAGRRAPLAADVDGLWYVNQHSDLFRLRSGAAGTTVRIYAWK
jgi:hypothetical protein